MNNILSKFSLFGFVVMLAFAACTHSHQEGDHEHESVEAKGPEYTSAYVCPMHCKGSGSDEDGTCPVCKMKYVLNEDAEGLHEHSGEGENEGEGEGEHEGKGEGQDEGEHQESHEEKSGHDHDHNH